MQLRVANSPVSDSEGATSRSSRVDRSRSGGAKKPCNGLLATLPAEDYAALQNQFEHVRLERGAVISRRRQTLDYIHFLEDGVASVVAASPDGTRIEVGLFGREGMSGTSILLGIRNSPFETFMQVAGSSLRLPVGNLLDAMRRSPSLREHLLHYVHVSSIQMAHTALASGAYSIGTRLARWLLMCHDRLEGDDLPLTHEFIALMLGVRRPGVTEHLHMLEGSKAIRSRRGRITVLDREKLEEAAGGSYGVPEAEYERLIGPFRSQNGHCMQTETASPD
jgi:CRP-like cAMP-binding protein